MDHLNHIVYSTDKNYWMHLYVSLYSLLKNNKENKFLVYILTDKTDEAFLSNTTFLYKIGNLFDCKIIEVDSSLAENFPTTYYFTKATYYRLFVGQLLPDDLEKVLYLDCDTIIEKSLDELFHMDLKDYVIGAAPDYHLFGLRHSERLNLPRKYKYFNAGVMLINLMNWRNKNIESRLFEWIEENNDKIDIVDQDVLNAVLYNEYKELNPKYNYLENKKIYQQDGKSFLEPSIIHYIWDKPWLYLSECLYKERYWTYLQETPYFRYREKDRNLKNYLIKFFCISLLKEYVKYMKKIPVIHKLLSLIKRYLII